MKTPGPLQRIWELVPNKLNTLEHNSPVLLTCKMINGIVHMTTVILKNSTVHS